MTYATVVFELAGHFPEWRKDIFGTKDDIEYVDKSEPLPYMVFGLVLLPRLKEAIGYNDRALIEAILGFVEDAAVSSRQDGTLKNLIGIEIGEWLRLAPHENVYSQYLGPETRRICGYVPGLATQRLEIRDEKRRRSLRNRLATFWGRGC